MRFLGIVVGLALIGCGETGATLIDAAVDSEIDGESFPPPDCCIEDGPPACGGLDPLSCRTTAGCVADFCSDCDCSPSYFGCRGVAEPMAKCPALDCPQPACCESDTECTAGALQCISPGESAGCGICRDVGSQCATDNDCRATAAGVGAVLICQPVACACNPANACVPGCLVDGDCGEAQTCDAPNGRCLPTACGVGAPCPPDFDCAAGACGRRTCTTDATCDGFCVEGVCRSELGECRPLPV